MTGLHVEDQLETCGSRLAQHAIDDIVDFAVTITAVASGLWLPDDGDELVSGNDVLLCRSRVRSGLLLQSFGKSLVLESPENAHSFRPGIPIPGDEKVVLEK